MPVPAGAVSQVEEALEQALQTGLQAALRRMDAEGLAGRLGARAAGLAEERLRAFVARQVFAVELAPGLEVPVRLIPR